MARMAQAEIRALSIECEKVVGIHLAQGVCDTDVPAPVRHGAQRLALLDPGDEGISSRSNPICG